jgi:hypothetical protein
MDSGNPRRHQATEMGSRLDEQSLWEQRTERSGWPYARDDPVHGPEMFNYACDHRSTVCIIQHGAGGISTDTPTTTTTTTTTTLPPCNPPCNPKFWLLSTVSVFG